VGLLGTLLSAAIHVCSCPATLTNPAAAQINSSLAAPGNPEQPSKPRLTSLRLLLASTVFNSGSLTQSGIRTPSCSAEFAHVVLNPQLSSVQQLEKGPPRRAFPPAVSSNRSQVSGSNKTHVTIARRAGHDGSFQKELTEFDWWFVSKRSSDEWRWINCWRSERSPKR
jgi:hypothetical protein